MAIIKQHAIEGLSELYGKKLSPQGLKLWMTVLEDCDEWDVKMACEWIVKDGIERMPSPAMVKKKCENVRGWRKKNEPAPVLICQYQDPRESISSRNLCCSVEPEDADVSVLQGWGTLCKWHYDVLYAKQFPDSTRTDFVEIMLQREPIRIGNQEIQSLKTKITQFQESCNRSDLDALI